MDAKVLSGTGSGATSKFDEILDKLGTVGNTVLDLQMKKALLDEQRDRVALQDGVYVPGTGGDAAMNASLDDKSAFGDLGNIQPIYLAAGALLLVLVLK